MMAPMKIRRRLPGRSSVPTWDAPKKETSTSKKKSTRRKTELSPSTVHGRYSKISTRRIADLLTSLRAEEEHVMDLAPEVSLLRALVHDFIERYDQFVDALMAWYLDPQNKLRPRKVMDIADAGALIESISRIVHRMHQIQSEGAISLATFQRVTEHMGRIVTKYVRDPEMLEKIESEWMDLALDGKPANPTDPHAFPDQTSTVH